MWYNPIGSIVALILSTLAVPFVTAAQPVGPVHRIGWLSAVRRKYVAGLT
jgi:hypothetical protein